MPTAISTRPTTNSITKTIALCVLIAGTLDITDALVFYGLRGVPASRLLQNIASGLLGPSAFKGGITTALVGLLIHYTITLCWATLFVLAARRIAALRQHAVISGLIYGLLIYGVMNYIVLPMTRVASHRHPTGIALINAVAALLFCMGLPISLINRRLS
jgi:hypothetical protein